MQPTHEAYSELEMAYDHFNDALYEGQLPKCLLTFQRDKRSYGYFASERFVNSSGVKTDEIAMNPAMFAVIPAAEIMQTLVHEMAHQWQFHFGKPGRRSYHNKEWGAKMEAIGLMPSNTGEPGGKKVGEQMMDYIIEGGRFEAACNELLSRLAITWRDRLPVQKLVDQVMAGTVEGVEAADLIAMGVELETPASKSNRRKYSCSKCGVNAWGKPNLNLICGECQERLEDVGA
ncbi:MAG: SprT-like domain-containing protein [Roseateles sp.]|uniref:SprT-like domain-containing protein n=1 Tax=Roseateles sp. TaxID=1971397 RepID=UPI004035B4F0